MPPRKIDRHTYALLSHTAERQTRSMARRLEILLRAQVRSLAEYVKAGHHAEAGIKALSEHWHQALVELKGKWGLRYAVDGYHLAGGLMGKRAYLPGAEAAVLADPQGKGSLIGFGSEELIANHLRARVGDWVDMTSNLETQTSARRLGKIYEEGMRGQKDPETGTVRSLTSHEMANYILSAGLADMPARAELMSRTMTIWGFNEGANQSYADSGITEIEWMTGQDDVTCEFCAAMDGKIVGTQDKFFAQGDSMLGNAGGSMSFGLDIDHPPLHPNCRCCLLPVV